jgi:hypothetical protein
MRRSLANERVASMSNAQSLKLVGAWRLVKYVESDETGKQTFPVGTQPVGSIIYSADQRMSAQIMKDSFTTSPDNLADAYFVGYSGLFTIDEQAAIVAHHIEVSAIPSWMGTVQRRHIRYNEDGTLTLTSVDPVHTASGTKRAEITWERFELPPNRTSSPLSNGGQA